MIKREETMDNPSKAIGRDKFDDDNMNWKKFEYPKICEGMDHFENKD
jgi:hypothetical protein